MSVPSKPVKQWNFCKVKWSHYISMANKFAKILLLHDSLDVDVVYQDFCNTISKVAKKTIPHIIKTTIFHVRMWSVNPSTKCSCSLREATQIWLLQLYLLNLTGSKGIDGLKQFGASTFHTLVGKHVVYYTTLRVGHDTLLITVLFQLMLLHLSWSEMGDTRLLIANHLNLFCKKCLTFRKPQHQGWGASIVLVRF